MSRRPNRIFEFGPYRLDAAERLLWRDGETVPLQPKVFDLLLVLVEHHGHLLEKDELMRMVWPDTVVEEANLANNISILRKTLSENGQPLIETMPKRGYRFVADVREVVAENAKPENGAQAVPADDPPEPMIVLPAPVPRISSRRISWRLLAIALGVLLVVAGGFYKWRDSQRPAVITSIAVLPFKPLVAESHDEVLEFGMADTLITRLSGLRQIIVRPISTMQKYTGAGLNPLAAGKEQQVDAVLESHFQRSGDRIRVTSRLFRVVDGTTVWAGKFDELYTDILTVQDSISEQIVWTLSLQLTNAEQKRLTRHDTENAEANRLYSQGRVYLDKRTEQALRHAIDCFRQATALDPNYTLAYAGLADSCSVLVWLNIAPPQEFSTLARASASKAVELDDTLAEAHTSLGRVSHTFDWDVPKAERAFQRALVLNANHAIARQWHADNLQVMGRGDEARAEMRLAQQLDPDSLPIARDIGRLLWFAHQYDQAITELRRSLELDANFSRAHRFLGLTYASKGMPQEAIAQLNQALSLSGGQTQLIAARGYAYVIAGQRHEAQEALAELRELAKQQYVSPYEVATIHVALGDKDKAFAWLEKAYAERNTWMLHLKFDPRFDSLHSDPRFIDLLRRINLEP